MSWMFVKENPGQPPGGRGREDAAGGPPNPEPGLLPGGGALSPLPASAVSWAPRADVRESLGPEASRNIAGGELSWRCLGLPGTAEPLETQELLTGPLRRCWEDDGQGAGWGSRWRAHLQEDSFV